MWLFGPSLHWFLSPSSLFTSERQNDEPYQGPYRLCAALLGFWAMLMPPLQHQWQNA